MTTNSIEFIRHEKARVDFLEKIYWAERGLEQFELELQNPEIPVNPDRNRAICDHYYKIITESQHGLLLLKEKP